MAQANEARTKVAELEPLRLARMVHARQAVAFKAWTSAEHIKRWFCPEGTTIPDAEVDPRPGGVFAYRMSMEGGAEHRVAGRFLEVTPSSRLVLDLEAYGADGKLMFRCVTEVDFTESLGGTQLEILQTYRDVDPDIAAMVAAHSGEGWGSTLDKLELEVVRMVGGEDVAERSAAHATFHLTRTYPHPVQKVWRALTQPEAKEKWFGGGTSAQLEVLERHMDLRVGGTERLKGRWQGGTVSDFQAVYHDVIPSQRLVYSYVMHLNDKKISVSLATMELRAEGASTTLAVTEQGVFLDGYDDAGSREHGTGMLLDLLGASLED
jgi:uncharacterized protein YndB with AHSA1/START domain